MFLFYYQTTGKRFSVFGCMTKHPLYVNNDMPSKFGGKNAVTLKLKMVFEVLTLSKTSAKKVMT